MSRVPLDGLERYGLPADPESRWSRRAGEIVAYETTPEFAYAAGE